MRNLKKLLAVIMAVAMLASIMVPALAADYDDDAQKLYNLGLFKGSSGSSYQPDLDGKLTREQGLTLMIRAMGKDEEALGMSEAEINEQLAKVEDAADITDWARPYVAYAVKNGLTKGIGGATPPNIKFGAQLDLSGKEFINFMLYAMGYTDAWDIVLDKAVEIGMLTAGEAVKFGSMDVIIRDVAIGIMAGSMGGTTAAGITLAQALVEAGVVTEEDMVEAGYMDPIVTPTPEPVVLTAEAYADNLIQVYVVYSEQVDEETAEDLDNYDLEDQDIESAELQDDGVTVVLTLDLDGDGMEQQSTADLTIKNVKSAAGVVIEKTVLEVEFLDETIPTVVNAEVVGNNTFKVTFSEPMKVLDKGQFIVNNGKMYVKKLDPQKNRTEVMVEMYSTLKEGEVTLQVKSGNEDYAGFGVIGKIFTLEVVPDEEAPEVIGYESAKRNIVTLIWNEDIKLLGNLDDEGALVDNEGLEDYYHTNSKSKAIKVTKDGNKTTLDFGDDDKNWLPAGTAYVYVMKDAVKDYWDNKNAQQMIKIEVEVDEVAPEIEEIEVDSEDKIIVKYNEDLDSDSAEDDDNYTVLDSDGKEMENIIRDIVYDNADKKVTIEFYDELNGNYTLIVKGVKDIFGNEMSETAVDFFVGDETAPIPDKNFSATLYNKGKLDQMIKISFGEKMATEGKYAINDDEKYKIGDKYLKDYKDYELVVAEDGAVLEIHIPYDKDDTGANRNPSLNADTGDNKSIKVARVADAAGNYTKELYFELAIKDAGTIYLAKDSEEKPFVHAIAKDEIKIKFDDNVVKFDIDDIKVEKTVSGAVYGEEIDIAGVDTELDSGKTVVYIKLGEDLPGDVNVSGAETTYSINIKSNSDSENAYGEKLTAGKYDIVDKIAPEVVDKGIKFTTANTITIEFSEELYNSADNSAQKRCAHDLIIVDRDKNVLTPIDDYETEISGKVITVTFNKKFGEDEDLAKYTIESVKDIRYIKDVHGNTAKAFDKVKN
jgi:hypothetical protein